MSGRKRFVSPEQLIYGVWLDYGMRACLGILVIALTLYMAGFPEPVVPLEEVPRRWSLSAEAYQDLIGIGTGWAWLKVAYRGDYLSYVGIALLSTLTIGCYLRILPLLLAMRDRIYASIVIGEVAVLVLAASGLLGGGH
ncbi:MAG: hypothetical protein FJX46_00460 [Alphaproteobacteria bacterium]|nr:hypothetical protein [Alphaproteobacteria bacterium]